MLHAQPVAMLGGFREDLIDTLGPLVGRGKITSTLTSMETYIRSQAEAGAREAIPEITAAVEAEAESTIKPYLLGAFGIGLVALAFGGAAYFGMRK
jgi:hypothetical protein